MGSIECILALGGAAYLSSTTSPRTAQLDILVGLFVSNILFGCGRLKEGLEAGAETAAEDGAHKAACKASNGGGCMQEIRSRTVGADGDSVHAQHRPV